MDGPLERPTVVCLTPVRNQAWILERFLRCTSLWADRIIIADQGSTDGSREIAAAFEKVELLDNSASEYDEAGRQRLLIDAARRIPGPRLIVALDADEILTANWFRSPEWASMLRRAPGTVVWFRRIEIYPDMQHCWVPDWEWAWGFIDDGSPHAGLPIHSPRVPNPDGAPSLAMRDIQVLHYASTDWRRLKSRQRWYQMFETLNRPPRRPAKTYRHYHQVDDPPEGRRPLERRWFEHYERQGIDMTSIHRDGRYEWDRRVLKLMVEHGPTRFRRLDLWDVDWKELARVHAIDPATVPSDPRSALDRLVLRYLRRTQRRAATTPVLHIDRALRLLGW